MSSFKLLLAATALLGCSTLVYAADNDQATPCENSSAAADFNGEPTDHPSVGKAVTIAGLESANRLCGDAIDAESLKGQLVLIFAISVAFDEQGMVFPCSAESYENDISKLKKFSKPIKEGKLTILGMSTSNGQARALSQWLRDNEMPYPAYNCSVSGIRADNAPYWILIAPDGTLIAAGEQIKVIAEELDHYSKKLSGGPAFMRMVTITGTTCKGLDRKLVYGKTNFEVEMEKIKAASEKEGEDAEECKKVYEAYQTWAESKVAAVENLFESAPSKALDRYADLVRSLPTAAAKLSEKNAKTAANKEVKALVTARKKLSQEMTKVNRGRKADSKSLRKQVDALDKLSNKTENTAIKNEAADIIREINTIAPPPQPTQPQNNNR